MKKVASYVRESNHRNADLGVQNQAQKVKDFCEAKGYEICDSASVVGDRKTGTPVLMELLKSAKEKEIETVVMVSTNRIVGTVEELTEIKKAFDDSGVAIEAIDGSHLAEMNMNFRFTGIMDEDQ